MIFLPRAVRVYFATAPVNLRKSFDGLSNEVRAVLVADPLSGHVFVFLNKRRTQVKLLVLTRGGFTIVHKRLERGTFFFRARGERSDQRGDRRARADNAARGDRACAGADKGAMGAGETLSIVARDWDRMTRVIICDATRICLRSTISPRYRKEVSDAASTTAPASEAH